MASFRCGLHHLEATHPTECLLFYGPVDPALGVNVFL